MWSERLPFKPILPTSMFYEMQYPVTLNHVSTWSLFIRTIEKAAQPLLIHLLWSHKVWCLYLSTGHLATVLVGFCSTHKFRWYHIIMKLHVTEAVLNCSEIVSWHAKKLVWHIFVMVRHEWEGRHGGIPLLRKFLWLLHLYFEAWVRHIWISW